jgi:hypothetical protein
MLQRRKKSGPSAVMASSDGCRSLAVFEIKDINKGLIPGFKGILEPDPSVLDPIEPDAADLAVIPGSLSTNTVTGWGSERAIMTGSCRS